MHLDANGATVGFHAMENKAHKTELTGGTLSSLTGLVLSHKQIRPKKESRIWTWEVLLYVIVYPVPLGQYPDV